MQEELSALRFRLNKVLKTKILGTRELQGGFSFTSQKWSEITYDYIRYNPYKVGL